MPSWSGENRRRPARDASGRRLILSLAVTIVLPGIVLTVLLARALFHERSQMQQRFAERLDHSAAVAERSLKELIASLQNRLQSAPGENITLDLPMDGTWMLVQRQGADMHVRPENALPYQLNVQETTEAADEATPATIKHRRALALVEAHRPAEAERLWRELEGEKATIGSQPADLVAGYQLAMLDDQAAQAFYDRLVNGRWRIEKSRYLDLLEQVGARVHRSPLEGAGLTRANIVETVLGGVRVLPSNGRTYIAIRPDDSAFPMLIVSDQFLVSRLPPAADAELVVARLRVDNHDIHTALSDVDGLTRGTRSFLASGLNWRLDVTALDEQALMSSLLRQWTLSAWLLALLFVLLTVGGFFTIRTIRREMHVTNLKADFVSTVSHEFRSPLTGIRQLGEMLLRDRIVDDTRRREYYRLILHESERLSRLVESVLDFARMEDGRKRYHIERLDSATWLRALTPELASEADRHGFRLEARVADTLPAIAGDREALTMAIRNLLDNAIKYSPDCQTIWLDADAVDDGLRIRVRDRGIGIASPQQGRIFEKFYRADSSLSRQVRGVGLGLSLVRHVVESHGGTVHVESREGEGSTFSIELAGTA